MKKIPFVLSMMLPVMALTVAFCFASQPTLAQSSSSSSPDATAQQQPMQPDNQNAASTPSEKTTFNGTITKSGNKLVLTATDSKTTYQLDDQQKAKDFLNKTVKVTGVLDASTGTIRVSAIDPS